MPRTVPVGYRAWPRSSSVSRLPCERLLCDTVCVCGARLWGVRARRSPEPSGGRIHYMECR